MEDQKTYERLAQLESNQQAVLDIASLYLAHTKANSLAIAALLGVFADKPELQERIKWHLDSASYSNLQEVPNPAYLESFERIAGFFKEAISKDLNNEERMRAH